MLFAPDGLLRVELVRRVPGLRCVFGRSGHHEPAGVKDLCKRFGGLQAVGNVSFTVAAGSIKALIGPNGAARRPL